MVPKNVQILFKVLLQRKVSSILHEGLFPKARKSDQNLPLPMNQKNTLKCSLEVNFKDCT